MTSFGRESVAVVSYSQQDNVITGLSLCVGACTSSLLACGAPLSMNSGCLSPHKDAHVRLIENPELAVRCERLLVSICWSCDEPATRTGWWGSGPEAGGVCVSGGGGGGGVGDPTFALRRLGWAVATLSAGWTPSTDPTPLVHPTRQTR